MKLYDIDKLPEYSPDFFEKFRSYPKDSVKKLIKTGCCPSPLITCKSVIWGKEIIETAKEEKIRELWCMETEEDPFKNLMAALTLENRKNCYSFREKKRILDFIKEKKLEDKINEISGMIQDEGDFSGYTEKYGRLPETLKEGIDKNLIDVKTAVILKDLPEKIFETIFKTDKKISYSERRIILKQFREISLRDGINGEKAEKLMDEIVKDEDPAGFTARLRYPKMEAMKKTFAEYIEKNIKGSGITLEAPPNFEGPAFTVKFQLKSSGQIDRIIRTLGKVRKNVDELFRLL